MKKYLHILIITCLCSATCFSQFSKTHYIPPVSNSDAQIPEEQVMYISCPSLTPVNFVITQIGSTTITGTVSRDTPFVYSIGTGIDTQFLIKSGDVNIIKNNKGFIVEASDLVYVTIRLKSGSSFQAGSIVSKGLAGLGKQFRIGAFTNTNIATTSNVHYTFATILATENLTTVSFGDIKPGVFLINNAAAGSNPPSIVLNRGESYAIAVEGPTPANKDGLIGAFINANKPIVVNCGSFGGTSSTGSLDLGMDQIVSAERTGKEYIFVKGNGVDMVEKPMIVADQNGTDVFLNGSPTPTTTLAAGQYLALDGTSFTANNNLYVRTSKNVFAYQAIGGTSSPANQNMHFLPPLSCETPKIINNIPFINQIGSDASFTGTVCLVTKTAATLDFIFNGVAYTPTTLPAGITITGPLAVTGNSNFVTYKLTGLTGNISVISSKDVYLSYFGSSGAATYGGFYSGFTFNPEISFNPISGVASNNCIPNVELKINAISAFDNFQWYFNGAIIAGATNNSYIPKTIAAGGKGPGYYHVVASINGCTSGSVSDKIPVSECPTNFDNDLANDNIDIDLDNDGISNCTESLGNLPINLSSLTAGTIVNSSYSNAFTGLVTTAGTTLPAGTITGNANGNFVSQVPAGKDNELTYKLTFTNPISVVLQYVNSALPADLSNSNANFTVNCPINQTITVLNPSNQLLIDTNYDGIYESNITQFSSFEIRFRMNGSVPLAAGTGDFSFRTYLTSSLSFTQKNLSDTVTNRATFNIMASCLPKDTDNDTIADQLDIDSDNDGITDFIENQGNNYPVTTSTLDSNANGMVDFYETLPATYPWNSDTDTVKNYLDLDSDNDGIYDLVEAGSTAIDTNNNGIIDEIAATFGTNGLFDSVETAVDSGILNYTLRNTDGLVFADYIDSDSDEDFCSDVVEAGFADPDNDFYLGTSPIVANANGVVTAAAGYTTPNSNYTTQAVISISTQPQSISTCELQSPASFSVITNAVNSYQWQLSTNGGTTWNNLTNTLPYSNVATSTLNIATVTAAMVGYQYRVFLNKNGNSCGKYSNAATLTTWALPTIVSPVILKQCDDDTDGISIFNLTEANRIISPSNYLLESFTFFTTQAAADTNNAAFLIPNPTTYSSGNTTTNPLWVRIVNSNGCYKVAQLNLIVSATAVNSTNFPVKIFTKCDDYIDAINNDYDGISEFNFSSVTAQIQAILPTPTSNYSIKYYRNLSDAEAEINAITNIATYRNIGYPNSQDIYVRIDSNLDNACYGLDKLVRLVVEKLPVFNMVGTANTIRKCDDNNDGLLNVSFDTSLLESQILNGQNPATKSFSYFDASGTSIARSMVIPSFNVSNTATIKVRITNIGGVSPACYTEKTITFIVYALAQNFANLINPTTSIKCDDERDPLLQNGLFAFDTSSFNSTILGAQTGMVLKYTDASGTVLTNIGGTALFVTGTQTIFATVSNPLNPNCAVKLPINFVVKPLPKIILLGDKETVCSNLPNLRVTLDAGIADGSLPTLYTYIWTRNGVVLPETTTSISVNADGIYTVAVKNSAGCSATRTINVYASSNATKTDIAIEDLTDIASINVAVTSGTGQYDFALDSEDNYQTSGFFNNVAIGFHTVYIRDLKGCGIVTRNIAVLGAPSFFTPNNDGFNDYWNLKGTSKSFNYKTTINIFNRFGTLVKQINPGNNGWDGTFDGKPAAADDYWYVIETADGRSAKGHFSLKR
jgi:gliding motility-associated-like protein